MSTESLQSPPLAELFRRYLAGQADAHAAGLASPEAFGDVVPHDAAPMQPIDARQAWDDALAVLAHFPGLPAQRFAPPPDWAALLASREPAVAVPFCLGNT